MKASGLKKLSQKRLVILRHRKTYGALRRHISSMPVGLPPTPGGVEKRLLAAMFAAFVVGLGLIVYARFA